MATILLSAAGASLGAGFGGAVLGLSGAVIGRAVGATLGRVIDQRLLGAGSQAVEGPRVDRFRLSSASEGDPVARVWGRMRLAGQVIWATRFVETQSTSGGGKGVPSQPKVTSYSYSVSLALALCEGEILRVGRIWADGIELAPTELNFRVYAGGEDQLPDPKIAAVEGAGMAPAYRGIAYVVIEDLALERFGNRVPQFTFEVVRAAQGALVDSVPDLTRGVEAVALIPGTGEFALATRAVHYDLGLGESGAGNVNSPSGLSDFATSLKALDEELPKCGATSLVVSWFGDDLRCGACQVQPKVEQAEFEGDSMSWTVSGVNRAAAGLVARAEGRVVYGGTPADGAVIEAIAALRAAGKAVMFYPFVLMEQLAGNALPDPYGGAEQAVLPWRGRITLEVAPGMAGSTDRTAAAEAEVAAFFGAAAPGDFAVDGETVVYSGPAEWSFRRMILHYAHLCALAGGVEAFCIGSELRGLTQIRGAGDSFPAVAALRQLAAEVRAILPGARIGYAADWSEYFGYQTPEGDLRYHLDPLWADENVDFVGIDNYLPLSDWRAGEDHLDASWGAIYNLDYLQANIEGGEYYDWYYASEAHRAAQIRTPITDGEGEPWVWRVKDIRNWWAHAHHERIGGVRQAVASAWVPEGKPIWFTELGCAAVDKGTNQPNKFIDPKSSESSLPYFSDGRRDELIQMQYLRAMADYWGAHNPVSGVYAGPMLEMGRAHVWAWDMRPFPYFPGNTELWADGGNYARGHWISGRAVAQPLASVVAEICGAAGLSSVDVSGLYGLVRGYALAGDETGRAALQPLMLAHGFEALEREGALVFRMRDGRVTAALGLQDLALGNDSAGLETLRAPEAEMMGRVRLSYIEAEGDFETRAVEALFPDETAAAAAQTALPLAMTRAEAQATAERWLAEARVARDGARFALPPSRAALGAGDVVALTTPEGVARYRLDRVETAGALEIEAVRVEAGVYQASDEAEERVVPKAFAAPVPVLPVFMDLPLLTGTEDPYAPHLAVTATPWPGTVAVYSAPEDNGYALNLTLSAKAVLGVTQTALPWAVAGVLDRGPALRVRLSGGALEAVSLGRMLEGANALAIGSDDGDVWEVMQFSQAVLVAPGLWEISGRLRGQAGTDGVMPEVWPVGSRVVLLNGAPAQIALAPSARGLVRHYRIGPARRGYDDPSYKHLVRAFAGVGLRPYAPVHLRADALGGDLALRWVRRTRIDGDGWEAVEVPLGEGSEAYLLRVVQGGAIRRELVLGEAAWTYTAAAQAADAVSGPFEIQVAQLSETFGPGPFARREING
ncbi:baseplate multidomain protein megatron [Phaeovulum sp. W22_SRMD_FR3]|uniref:baseplate multidomain protein megatron n=1 Tax=Phaeovulum sp. W22_SRMD_FR3 TaxID=3240274 RepID=UPI003F9C9472